jgi:hypothetical protein
MAQQTKANAARAEAEAARPGKGKFYSAPRLALHPFPRSFLCNSRAFWRSGGGGGTRRPCGFDRARSRLAKIIKGAKKAAYYPKMRHSLQSLAWRLASPPLPAGRFVVP